MSTTRLRVAKIAWSLAIVLASAAAGLLVDWQAPGIARYTRDWLMRGRGTISSLISAVWKCLSSDGT